MHAQPVALVTGGSRGIGRGICLALAHAGYAVAVNYASNRTAAEETCRLAEPAPTFPIQADVSLTAERNRMVDEVLGRFGRIDVLVNNAGISSVGRQDILIANEASWDAVLGTNLKGPFFLTQRVANEMVRFATATLQQPCIINISSLSATTVSVNRGDYCIAKSAMRMLTQLFAVRLAEHGIRVYEVRPGIIDTDMTAGARERYLQRIADGLTPIRRMGTPDDVGQAVALLATGHLPYSTGDVLNVDGGFHARQL